MEIQPNEIYTFNETLELLKVSKSTLLRLTKQGALRAGKIGAQHRFLGRDILHAINPEWEEQARQLYRKGRDWVKKED